MLLRSIGTLSIRKRVSSFVFGSIAALGLAMVRIIGVIVQPAQACTANPTANCEFSQDTADSLASIKCGALVGTTAGITGLSGGAAGPAAVIAASGCIL